jgi:glycosyltransferase involved in cell wall biosynthesis
LNEFTFCVCTYNSARTIDNCLESIRRINSRGRIIVVDHHSSDGTEQKAKTFGAEIYSEDKGLGRARQICLDLVETPYLVFVDSDVEIIRPDFLELSEKFLGKSNCGAVAGLSTGHRFAYGLPASLLVLRKGDFLGRTIPDYIDARETFFLQRRLNELGLQTSYVYEAMKHRSEYRKFKPEWEGANTRILPSFMLSELGFTAKVILLLTLNSKNWTNVAYLPIFYLKFFRGFVQPEKWVRLSRPPNGGSVLRNSSMN